MCESQNRESCEQIRVCGQTLGCGMPERVNLPADARNVPGCDLDVRSAHRRANVRRMGKGIGPELFLEEAVAKGCVLDHAHKVRAGLMAAPAK
eukprot:1582727-Rhodomonas_salina.1